MQSSKFIFCSLLLMSTVLFSQKLQYDNPSSVGMDSLYVHRKVDSIIKDAIKNQAFPGAQILVAKNHKIVFHKAYGFQSYDSITKVGLEDVYDLASVTKILGPLPAIMKLYDEGKLNLDLPFSKYWTPWKYRTDKKNLSLREILAHQAGLTPYIVFLNEVLKKDKSTKPRFVQKTEKERFTSQAYEQLFIKDRFKNKMYRHIIRSKVSQVKKYNYSGVAFLLFPKMIFDLTKKEYTGYLQENFYQPLGANSLGYLPKKRGVSKNIIPTEFDSIFRKDLTQSWVHDENAALMGGVSGNAGLFGSALDLAKIMQMYSNYGYYDYKQYISKRTLKEFTKVQYPENGNRRGLGFDKPLLGNDTLDIANAYPAPEVSAESFGHSGFTGTFVWADPTHDLIFIFLSNRVYPSRSHQNIYKLNIRPKVQQVFYQALKKVKINE